MELSSLAAACGLPDFATLGPELCVPFEVRALRHARVLWLNEGWLLQSGVNVQDPETRYAIANALLEEFAVSSSPDDFRHTHGKRRTLFADRYGASGGMPHGGSGRCGLSKQFNAKGIGRTPLAPDNVDWDHSHGFLWLDEAIREVVGAEIAAAELPRGAVPVIALIDTGIEYSPGHGEFARRRAIVVRPNFLRPAHFERSLYFGSSGQPGSAQFLDAQRVRRMVGEGALCLRDLFEACARQIGAARALRLWQGRFLTSNIAIDGALVDFGSFRAVANWRRAQGLPGEVFGQESRFLRLAADSLCFYFRKYGPRGGEVPDPNALMKRTEQILDQEFDRTTLRAFGLDAHTQPRASAGLLDRIRRYYERQQRESVRVDDPRDLRRPWIYDLIRPGAQMHSLRHHRPCDESFALALQVLDAFPDIGSTGVTLLAAQRWFRPRPHLLYGLAARSARTQSRRLTRAGEHASDSLTRYIDRQLTRSRRHWPQLPLHLDVRAQVCRGFSAALYCVHKVTGESRLWIEGSASPTHWHAFGSHVPLADLELAPHSRLGVEVCNPSITDRHGGRITIAGREFTIPPAGLRYGA